MSYAETFIKQLREGNTSDAIETIKLSLEEKRDETIKEQEQEVLKSVGFSISEKKHYKEEEEEKDKDRDKDDDDTEEDDDKKDDKDEE